MTMTEWFLAELESEAAKSRRVLEQVPTGKRDWKPHERSMALGYLSDLVANIPSWVGMAITLDELDVAPKDGPQVQTSSTEHERGARCGARQGHCPGSGGPAEDHRCAPRDPLRLLAGGQLAFEQPRHQVIRDTFLHSAHHRGQMTVYLRLLGSKVPSVYGPTADDRSFG